MGKLRLEKPTKKQVKKLFIYILIIILGNAIAASACAFFIEPLNLTMGGTTGLGIFLGHFLWPDNEFAVSIVVYVANIALLIIGFFFLGKKFALATLAGTILYPSFMSLWTAVNQAVNNGNPITSNPLLATVCGALLFGAGVGIVIRVGASTGGTDIPALILHKYAHVPVAVALWIFDISIIVLQVITAGVEGMLYGILLSLIVILMVDKISPIGIRKTQVQIISKEYRKIREMIINKLNRGVTMYVAKTGFLQEHTFVLMTVVSNRDVVKLTSEVQAIDPEAFIMVGVVSEVKGRGFSTDKISLPHTPEVDVFKEDL